jgi:hypothetical protein
MMDALVSRVIELTKLSHVSQLLGIVISNDTEFEKHLDAFGAVLAEADIEPTRHLPEEALRLVAKAGELNDRLDDAMKEANYADLFGRPSMYQATLRMRTSAVYDQDGPPPEIIEMIAAFQKGILAYFVLMYAGSRRPDASPELLIYLAQLFHDGLLARLRHLASLGYTVDEATVPSDQRLDLAAIYAEHEAWEESLRREGDEFAAQRLAARSTP